MYQELLDIQNTPHWKPPVFPPPCDPAWGQLFDDSNTPQKRNLANAWIWQLNQEAEAQAINCNLEWASKYRDMYRKACRYADGDVCTDEYFPANIHALFKDRSTTFYQRETADRLSAALTALWLAVEKEETVAALEELHASYHACHAENLDEFIVLMNHLVWDAIDKHDLQEHPRLVELGVDLSVECGLLVKTLDHESSNDIARSWHSLSAYAISGARMGDGRYALVSSVIPRQEPLLVMEQLLKILPRATETFASGAIGYESDTVFNRSRHQSTKVYQPLYIFVPTYKKFWSTCEALSVEIGEAINQAKALHKISVERGGALPAGTDYTVLTA